MVTKTDARTKFENAKERLREDVELADTDAVAIEEFLEAIDAENPAREFINEAGTGEISSVHQLHCYYKDLRRVAVLSERLLIEMSSADLSAMMEQLANGSHPHPSAKAEGYSSSTLQGWKTCLEKFYQYHTESGIDPVQLRDGW